MDSDSLSAEEEWAWPVTAGDSEARFRFRSVVLVFWPKLTSRRENLGGGVIFSFGDSYRPILSLKDSGDWNGWAQELKSSQKQR